MISPLSTDPRAAGPPAARDSRRCARWPAWPAPRSAPLAESAFWARLRDDRRGCSRRAGRPPPAGRASTTIERRHGGDRVSLGGWHGDWGRWNMGMGDGVLQLWDWERYDAEVPIGFDALHFAAQSVRPGEREERRQEDGVPAVGPRAPWPSSASTPTTTTSPSASTCSRSPSATSTR